MPSSFHSRVRPREGGALTYGICGFAITITEVKKGERICPAKYHGGDDAPDCEGGAMCEGEVAF